MGDETVLQARELHTSLREHCSGARRSKGEAAAMVDGTALRASGEGHGEGASAPVMAAGIADGAPPRNASGRFRT